GDVPNASLHPPCHGKPGTKQSDDPMNKFRSITGATTVLTLACSWAICAQTADLTGPLHIPRTDSSRGESFNWSGYAVSDANVTSVTGTFNVPTISGPDTIRKLPPDVSAWVGIDGYTSGTVEQIGIAGTWDTATHQAVYYAWWEMYPRNSQVIKEMT